MTGQSRKRRPRTVRCKGCRKAIALKSRGRIPSYCGQTCRQRAYLVRRFTGPMQLLAQDIATVQVRDVICAKIWVILKQLGLVGGPPTQAQQAKTRQQPPAPGAR